MNDFIGTDDKIVEAGCEYPEAIETNILHKSDGFKDLVRRPLDEVTFRARVVGSELTPQYRCYYTVQHSRGGSRNVDVEVRIAKGSAGFLYGPSVPNDAPSLADVPIALKRIQRAPNEPPSCWAASSFRPDPPIAARPRAITKGLGNHRGLKGRSSRRE